MRQQLWDKTAIIFAVGIFLTFVAFDVIWCMDTTFASFSFFETYATKIIATLALAGVYALTRCRWAQIVVMALLDVLLVANLMYFRTYYSAIPASSYLEAGQSCRLQGKCDRLAAVGRHRPAAHHHSNSRHGISLQNHQASAADSRAEMVGSAACRLRPAAHGRQSVQRRLPQVVALRASIGLSLLCRRAYLLGLRMHLV